MVISKVIGGLGNQMFQYAIGRAVSLRLQAKLKLDTSEFDGYVLHQGYELDRVFNLQVPIANKQEVRKLLGWQSYPLMQRIVARFCPYGGVGDMVYEPHFHYWQGVKGIVGSCYLAGYWQSEKYFSEIESLIRQDFSFKTIADDKNKNLVDNIQSVNAISLHVRRGDYVNSAKTNVMHGTCSLDYYQAAMDYMIQQVDEPCFIVFSDDIQWVKANLSISHACRFVDYNQGENSFRDMQLMALCQHHIIANSTFSWWGAWLNANKDKIVIAPKYWFAHNKCSTQDLYPSGWMIL